MKKLINTGDRIRIALVCCGKILGHLYGSGGSTDWYYRPWKIINVSQQAYRTALSRQLKTGEITKVVDPIKGAIYRLSAGGYSKYYRDYPLAKLRDKAWDGKWRMVFYDFPCKQNDIRRLLREKLLELGFGCYQKSVYVTPLDVLEDLREYVVNNKMSDSVVVFEGRRIFGENIKTIAERLWGLGELNEGYLDLEKKIKPESTGLRQERDFGLIWDELSRLLLKDPFLPPEFLPTGWAGDRVITKILGKR